MSASKRLGTHLGALRVQARMTLDDVAARSGIEAAHLAAFEAGERLPSAEQIAILASVFRISCLALVAESIEQPRHGALIKPKIHLFHSGHGSTVEEADREKMLQKLGEIPYYDLDMPEDLSIEELQAIVTENSNTIATAAVAMHTAMRAIRNDVLPAEDIEKIRMKLRDICFTRNGIDDLMSRE